MIIPQSITRFFTGRTEQPARKPRVAASSVQNTPTVTTAMPSAHSRDELSAALEELKRRCGEAELERDNAKARLSVRKAELSETTSKRDGYRRAGQFDNESEHGVEVLSALVAGASDELAEKENELSRLTSERSHMQQQITIIDAEASIRKKISEIDELMATGNEAVQAERNKRRKYLEVINDLYSIANEYDAREPRIANYARRAANEVSLHAQDIRTEAERSIIQ